MELSARGWKGWQLQRNWKVGHPFDGFEWYAGTILRVTNCRNPANSHHKRGLYFSWNHGGCGNLSSSAPLATRKKASAGKQKSWWRRAFTIVHLPWSQEKTLQKATSVVYEGRWIQAFYCFHHDFIAFWRPRVWIIGEVEAPTLQVPPWEVASWN